jgi:hypothetical protein
MNVLLTYRKRGIIKPDLSFILKVIDEYRSEGRNDISTTWPNTKSDLRYNGEKIYFRSLLSTGLRFIERLSSVVENMPH